MLADLAPWDANGTGNVYARLNVALPRAGVDVARAIITLATGVGAVPAAVAPHAADLAPHVALAKRAIADGFVDEETLNALIG